MSEGNDISADGYFGYGPLLSTNGGDTWELKKDNLFAGTRINAIVLEPAEYERRLDAFFGSTIGAGS